MDGILKEMSLQSCMAEFFGTFILVFAIGCNVLGEIGTWGGVSIACTLIVITYAFCDASGANFNPAVSLALALAKKENPSKMGMYCCVQVLGACTAALCYSILYEGGFSLSPVSVTGALICEFFYTFMLCFVFLNVVLSSKLKGKNQSFGLAIGFVIIAGTYGSAPLGAGCFNPAVAIGVTASGLFSGASWCLLYIFAELAGAALAVGAFWLVRPEEKDGPEPPKQLKPTLVSEAIGTFMLVLTVGLNVLGQTKAGAFSMAASFTSMVCALGDISGGHFNPAVTTAVYFSGKSTLSTVDAGYYTLVQIGSGILASFTYAIAYHGASFALGPNDGWSWLSVMFVELIFTFVLVSVFLCVKFQKDTPEIPEVFGFVIGSCLIVGGCAASPISGGSMNPAVSMGIAAADLLGGGALVEGLIYSMCELLGGAVAVGIFKVVYGQLLEGLSKGADPEDGAAGKMLTK